MASIVVKHKLELADKYRDIEQAKLYAQSNLDEKIRQAVSDSETESKQRAKELEINLTRAQAEVQKLKNTLDNIPPELRGTAGEFVLLDELRTGFSPPDELIPKKECSRSMHYK
jgi:hypothetical protein